MRCRGGGNLTIVVAPDPQPHSHRRQARHDPRNAGKALTLLVTDHGIAVNPARPEVKRLTAAGLPVVDIGLYQTSL
ncbi:MAG: citrate lyase subunit alpha [Enterobacteriaceae bacterium]